MNDTQVMTTPVPFADLAAQHAPIRSEIDAAIAAVIEKNAFIRGPFVDAFEAEFATAIGAPHCVSCANGTDAIYIAMRALGVEPGDEVIVPAMSWIATSETVTQTGATVVFCDVDPATYTMDPADVEAKLTERTVGLIPVHLYGQPADMGALGRIAEKHGLWVIEDSAQAHLAQYGNQPAGTLGTVGTFSFYPGKNLGALGDAGAIVTGDPALAERMAMFARHGGLTKGEHWIEGINSRLDGLQAAVLSVKLPHLAGWTAARQTVASAYGARLAGTPGLTLPATGPDRTHVWHLYVVRHPKRDEMAAFLRSRGIATGVHYPTALPFLPCYARLAHQAPDFPNAHALQSQILSLPIFAEMTERQIDAVTDAVREFCGA